MFGVDVAGREEESCSGQVDFLAPTDTSKLI